jgi:hypothetical protein
MLILAGAIKSRGGDVTGSVALPVKSIARALVKLDPGLGAAVFKDIPEEEPSVPPAPDLPFQESDFPEDTAPVVPQLSAVASDVRNPVGRLRAKAGTASTLIVNFIAKQCLVQGAQRPLCHEVSILDGEETYREITKNDRLGESTRSFPILKHGVWPLSAWADTLREIADNPWVFQGSVGDHYLFTFRSKAEDDRCYFEEHPGGIPLFGGGHLEWKGSVACFEQVLTDKEFNVVSAFTEMSPPEGCLTQLFQSAVYYDWIALEDLDSPVLLPVKERITAKVQGQKDLWYTTVSWTDYKRFRAEHRIRW